MAIKSAVERRMLLGTSNVAVRSDVGWRSLLMVGDSPSSHVNYPPSQGPITAGLSHNKKTN